jgi:antitoxin component YwqK of YwqJK toxin-antitoxin module
MRLFVLTAVLFFFFGCGSPDLDEPKILDDIIAEAIDQDKLQMRGEEGEELFYAQNEQTPYSGWTKSLHDNGQIHVLKQYKGGKRDGLSALWFKNGNKCMEDNWKDGKKDGLSTGWYENGQIREESNWKDDKLVSYTVWKPNGEKCPITNVVDGNGVCVVYSENGTEKWRQRYKDGVRVK